MAGHSHWANIKRKKDVIDAKRGKVFSKLARHITNAARIGGGDPDMNIQLKYAIEKAQQCSMPKDNIDRALKKGTGELGGGQMESILYEAIGPGGVFILIDILTDNRNRTASEIRKLLEMKNARLGSAAWAFEQKGLIIISSEGISEDQLLEKALDAGAEDVQCVGTNYQITTTPADLETVRRALADKMFKAEMAEVTRLPKSTVPVDEETGKKLLELMEQLEDHDDVQNVYSNFDLPEQLLKSVS